MEPMHGGHACLLGPVVDEGAVALRDQKDALDGAGRLPGEMVLQVGDARARGKIADPERVAGLFRLAGRPSRRGGDRGSPRPGHASTERYRR